MAPREARIEHGDRLTERRRLGEPHRPGDDDPADLGRRSASRTSSATCSASLVRASYMVRTMVETSSVGVEVGRDQVDVAQELAQALEGVVLALDRDEHLVGRGQAR